MSKIKSKELLFSSKLFSSSLLLGMIKINILVEKIKKRKLPQKIDVVDNYDFFIDEIIRDAYRLGASDIHLEPGKKYYRVRIRKDGKLQERIGGDMQNFQHMINRIKYLANMNIAEKRIPQDGAIRWQQPVADIRISTMPTAYGEKCVIRILISQQLTDDFTSLGMPTQCKYNFHEILRKNSGLILVTGPTGSGKSTTLYTSLHHLNNSQKNIITIEDPIEYMIDGINQMQIHEQRGVTFNSALRSILRQDPDVIMIGEIRDKETAEIAIRAALTGHLILSTLHTNDSISALFRLLDMGVEPYLAVQAITGIVSQRLSRKICNICNGIGCDSCYNTGYSGRIGIFELLTIDDEIANHIKNKNSTKSIKDVLLKNNWQDMLCHAQELKELGVIDETEYQELYYAIK